MSQRSNRVCPVERAGGLDSRFRRWFQDPWKILKPYVMEGMTVLDVGCGPGFFTGAMAEMVGDTGHVIAADLQEGMLAKLNGKIQGTEIEQRVTLHQCDKNEIGLAGTFDFILLFYVVHEIPGKRALFAELEKMLKGDGRIFIAEPAFHVSKRAFEETIHLANAAGLTVSERPRLLLSRAAVLKRASV